MESFNSNDLVEFLKFHGKPDYENDGVIHDSFSRLQAGINEIMECISSQMELEEIESCNLFTTNGAGVKGQSNWTDTIWISYEIVGLPVEGFSLKVGLQENQEHVYFFAEIETQSVQNKELNQAVKWLESQINESFIQKINLDSNIDECEFRLGNFVENLKKAKLFKTVFETINYYNKILPAKKEDEFLKALTFFKELKVNVDDVTTSDERNDDKRVVIATYQYKGKLYETKRLYYIHPKHLDGGHRQDQLENFFGDDLFWLDYKQHQWPEGRGAEIENRVIKDMFDGDNAEFEELLKAIANNQKNGYLQVLTKQGRSQQYGFNFENNNHWHDLIHLVQEAIGRKGKEPDRKFFKPLVFKWYNDHRQSLSPFFGSRALVTCLLNNIINYSNDFFIMDIKKILGHKKQIILQGPSRYR